MVLKHPSVGETRPSVVFSRSAHGDVRVGSRIGPPSSRMGCRVGGHECGVPNVYTGRGAPQGHSNSRQQGAFLSAAPHHNAVSAVGGAIPLPRVGWTSSSKSQETSRRTKSQNFVQRCERILCRSGPLSLVLIYCCVHQAVVREAWCAVGGQRCLAQARRRRGASSPTPYE